MSAYVMPTDFFNKLATHLKVTAEDGEYDMRAVVKNYLDDVPQRALDVVQALADGNVEAVRERYPYDNQQKFEVEYGVEPNWSPVQFYKHLQCLSYQMCEGAVADSCTRNKLNGLIGKVASVIVNQLPEYGESNWGGR